MTRLLRSFTRFTAWLSLLLFVATSASAQNIREEIAADPYKAGGVYYMYSFAERTTTPAPAGYVPFHISHYGRHGARFILNNEEYDTPYTVLGQAYRDGKLTPTGIDFYERFARIYPQLQNRAGDLSPKGQQQHRLLAKRMYRAYPEIFTQHPRIDAVSTVVGRCIMSMAAFSEGLKEEDPSLEVHRDVGEIYMLFLNPYLPSNPELSTEDYEYKLPHAPWRATWRRFCNGYLDIDGFLQRIFTDTDYAKSLCDPFDLELDIFYIAVHMPCTNSDEEFINLFTSEELFRLWECDNIPYYIAKGPYPGNKGHMTAIPRPILREILDAGDAAIASGEPSVKLRFGHDGCIMGLLNLMRVGTWATPTSNPLEIRNLWQSYKIPMASNLQFIFYKSEQQDEILVKMLFNEEETLLPLPDDLAPYYRWSDFSRYYRQVLQEAKDNML